MKEIAISEKLAPFVKAFSMDDQSAKLLIAEVSKAIAKATSSTDVFDCYKEKSLSEEELDGIIVLMRELAPQDSMETIYASQIVSSHFLGLRMLSHDFAADRLLGLKLLKFSNEAIGKLLKKRLEWGNQHINITFNHEGIAMTQILTKDSSCQ